MAHFDRVRAEVGGDYEGMQRRFMMDFAQAQSPEEQVHVISVYKRRLMSEEYGLDLPDATEVIGDWVGSLG